MKEILKKFLLTSSVFYSIMIIILMIIKIVTLVETIELVDVEENKNKIEEYKTTLATLEKNKCTETIDKIIKYYENTSYNGKVPLKEIYDYNSFKSILTYYMEVKENCNLSDEIMKENKLPERVLTGAIAKEEVYQRYLFQYELSLPDFYMRNIGEAALTNSEYKIYRKAELEVISSLIEIISKEAVNEQT